MVTEQAAAVGWAAHFEAAGHPVHFHRLLDHQVAKEALPRRSKVRILAETIKNRCMSVTCIANMRNIQNMYNMTDMFNMTNMTNMKPRPWHSVPMARPSVFFPDLSCNLFHSISGIS
jgi:hypothetical protein